MSPTFHVQLYPTTFPPAKIDLEAEKRSFHRRRSTRRLEAARGTTPHFLDLDSKRDFMTNPPTSPRTARAVRRKGQLFNSPSSPISSTDSDSFANARGQSDDSDLQVLSPLSSCSLSPLTAGNPVANGNSNRAISGRFKAGNTKAKTTKTEGPQRLAQPFLLQLRSLPVPLNANIKPSNPAANINSNSLSPTSSCFNMLSTTTSTRPPPDLSFDAKRRKLAKLERFLGENIPPELVFPTTPTTHLQRSTSVLDSGSRGRVSHKPSRSLPTSQTPAPLNLSTVPGRAAAAPTPTTPQLQSAREPGTRVEDQSTARPQSMTTVPSPTMPTVPTQPARGTSLDGPPFQKTAEPETTPVDQRRYRKEGKGWSGEWNVKDMERVANALRGLKAR